MQVRSLVRDLRSHLPCSQKKQNMKQKKYCNKFNKDFKNGPHEKNLFKNCHLLNIYTANMNDPYRPPQSCHKPPRERQRDENFSQEVITRLQGPDFTAILPPGALIVSVESLQFRPDVCQSLLILHGTKPNCNEMASLHARLDRYEYLRGSLVYLFLAHEM